MRAVSVTFPASDYAQSKRFYETVLYWPVAREFDGEPHRFTNYELGGVQLKVYEWTEPYHGSGHSGLIIECDDLDATVARVRAAGAGATEVEVHEWGGRCSTIKDPFGNLFTLIDAGQKGEL